MNYFEAISAMYDGYTVKHIGSLYENGELVPSTNDTIYCMFRGAIFSIINDVFETTTLIYDPYFRFKIEGINIRGTGYWPNLDITPKPIKPYYTRNGVIYIDDLKPCKMYGKDNKIRYDFHEMTSIINHKLGFDVRGCANDLVDLGFDIPINDNTIDKFRVGQLEYCDFWHYQLKAIFRVEVSNGQCNTIYVGTPDSMDLKKFKQQPNTWQLFLLTEWNKMFSHLADDKGYIKVEVWW